MKVKTRFLLLFSFIVIFMLIVLVGVLAVLKNQKELYNSQVNRYYSYKLGDALRQSDDHLTEYCKNYVITGDTIWEHKYWQLVKLREGELVQENGWGQSLVDSMRSLGFAKEEFELLRVAQIKSNELVKKETMAFNAAKGLFEDSTGQFTIKREPDKEYALKLLHDKEYLLMKQAILEPIIKFESLIETRTNITAEQYADKGERFLIITIVLIITTITFSIVAYTIINKRLSKEDEMANQLKDRVKEQSCLHKVSLLTESTANTLEHVLDGTASAIPFGWHYPEITCARVSFKDKSFTSGKFKESEWKQEADIVYKNELVGKIEVFYTELKTMEDHGPFLKEEQILLESIANLIASYYERKLHEENLVTINNDLRSEIAEKLKTEEELRLSEERFLLAAKGSNAGIWDLNVETGVAYWSPIHYELLGYAPDEFTPTLSFVLDSVHDEDKEIFKGAVNSHIEEGAPLDFEARFYTKSKELKWFRSTAESARDKEGKSFRMVGTFSDVTTQKNAENALVAKEQQLQYALDVSNEGIWEWNDQLEAIVYSNRCYSMIGYDPPEEDDKIEEFWKCVIHRDDENHALINRLEEVKTSGLYDSIYRIVARSKEIKWIHTKGKAVEFAEDGKPARVVGTMSDITERMAQEEKVVNAVLETEDKERSRIARDIHDGLQQTMSTALMSLEKVRSSVDFQDRKIYDKFHLGYQYLKKAIEESRTLAHNLMPKVVSKSGIVSATNSLLNAIGDSSATNFIFDQNLNQDRLKLSEEMTFYRIIQEATNNVIKYANAKNCNIQLLKHHDVVILTIEDDGDGFDMATTSNTFGINSMKTRSESIGAFFEIISQPGRGTKILMELPLKK